VRGSELQNDIRDLNFDVQTKEKMFLMRMCFFCSLQVNKLNGHSARVGALAWNSDILSSGSRDRLIMQRDTRTPPQTCERRLEGHRQEVCGLKWSPGKLT
jgi:WD40 repeat protein